MSNNFAEHGVSVLSGILNNEHTVAINIEIRQVIDLSMDRIKPTKTGLRAKK